MTRDPKRLSEEGDLSKLLTAARGDGHERVGARERIWKGVTGAPKAPSPLRILVPAVGLLSAAAVAFVALKPEPVPLVAPPETFATLTLVAGTVESAVAGPWAPAAIGNRISEGTRLRTGLGRAYARFAAAGVLIDPGTRMALRRGALALDQGTLSIAVRHGTGGLAVEAGDYRVEVTGTVFQVDVAPEREHQRVTVYVHEGEVVVRGPAADVRVKAGESWNSRTAEGHETMAPADVATVRALAFSDAREAVLTITEPNDAEVTVDGVRLFRAPVTVVQRVGPHEILAGGRSRRAVLLPEGTTVDLEEEPLPTLAPPREPSRPREPGERDPEPMLQRTILAPGVSASDRDTARYELARELSRTGRHTEALHLYLTLSRGHGAWAEPAAYEVGRLRLRYLNDAPGAVEAFTAYRARWPKGALAPEVALSLIESQLEAGAPAEAVKEIDLFLATWPDNERAADVRTVREKIK